MARSKKTETPAIDPNRPPKHARHARRAKQPDQVEETIDSGTEVAVQSGFSIFNQTPPQEHMMSESDTKKAKKSAEEIAAAKAEREAAKAAKAAEKEAAKAEKVAEREAAKAAKAAEKEAAKAEREAKRAERLAALEAAGPLTKMHALRDAKSKYVKSATGQLRSTDELAEAFDRVTPSGAIAICMVVLGLESNPYAHLNVGQQSMNLRNKLRGAIRRGVVTIDRVIDARDAGGHVLSDEDLAPKRKSKAEEQETAEA